MQRKDSEFVRKIKREMNMKVAAWGEVGALPNKPIKKGALTALKPLHRHITECTMCAQLLQILIRALGAVK